MTNCSGCQASSLLFPQPARAACAWKAVELDANHADDRQVDEAARESPNCAYLKLLNGDRKYLREDLPGALADYQEAARREPKLAEAHFDMARILDRQDNPDSALPEYQLAASLSPGVPRYHHNLADLYFRSGDYDKAIEEYGLMGEFPLAALELGKIYRLQGKLEQAHGRELDAVKLLKDPAVQAAEQPNGWAFDVSPIKQVRLGPLVEKQCYADLELATTRFLEGDEGQAPAVSAAFEKCSSRTDELKGILSWELHRLGSENQKLAERCDAFARRFLAARNTH